MTRARPHLIPGLVAVVMLVIGGISGEHGWDFLYLPYGYFQLLRWVVCAVSIFIIYKAVVWHRTWAIWLFIAIAILFNPLMPIVLSRQTWRIIDLVTAVLFAFSIVMVKKKD